MFGERIDAHITMAQRVVALVRDLIIGTTAGLTVAIVAFGGDPTKLSPLDWARPVQASFLIVLAPIPTYILVREISSLYYLGVGSLPIEFITPGPIPRGGIIKLALLLSRTSPWRYARQVKATRRAAQHYESSFPRLWKTGMWLYRGAERFYEAQRRWNPVLYAVIAAIYAVGYFLLVFRRHIPA